MVKTINNLFDNRDVKEHINKTINRITIALDDTSSNYLQELKGSLKVSQSEIVRKAIEFYQRYGHLFGNGKNIDNKLNMYLDMLSDGDHIILDVDHYLSILKFIEESPNKEKYWEEHKKIGRSQAEQFSEKIKTFEDVVKRLETCNFFKIIKESQSRYTLLLGTDLSKNFIKILLEEVFNGMGFKVEIKEGFAKLIILLKNVVL